MSFKIENKFIGSDYPPFIVAEMSGNHNQSLDRAIRIVEEAARCGADAVKLQTYTADTITLDIREREFFISDPSSIWKGTSMHELYKQAYTPWEWHETIFRRCRELGIICFSSPFDHSALEFLEKLACPMYKIASPEIVDIPLIMKTAATGKPLIISNGMATLEEMKEAVEAAKKAGAKDIVLLKCTTSYPASPKDSNIATIPDIRTRLGTEVGISDHTLGIGVSVASVALGACLIEKHFTLDRSEGGVDSSFSLEPAELKMLVSEAKKAWEAIGTIHYGPTDVEKNSVKNRRSLYITKDMAKGEPLTPENVRSIRPGLGLPPKHYFEILGKKIVKNVSKGTPLSWDLIDKA